MSPERIGTPHDESSGTMSVPASPIAGTPAREARSPLSLLLAVAQAQNQSRSPDDDLTSLTWLQNRDLLKGMNINPSPSNRATPIKTKCSNESPTSDYAEESFSTGEASNPSPTSYHLSQIKNKHPHNIPYDPLVHTNNKPPYSFSCLIFMAIEDSNQKALPVKDIYTWILNHFPYFQHAPTGWKNSVRHNLSLNKCFQKVEKAPNLGKGSLWTVDEQYKPNLIQSLTRSPFHPCSTIDPSTFLAPQRQEVEPSPSGRSLPNPELFPFLSKRLASTSTENKAEVEESLDTVDAAAVMLSLKNGPSNRNQNWIQIITTSPSQDHTYSAANEKRAAAEEARAKSLICRKLDFEDEEERKIKEGAETLLNLAGITTRRRTNSDCEPPHKRTRLENDSYFAHESKSFKPRLLRPKMSIQNYIINNNNNEWMGHQIEHCGER